ncbi:hypothetical protein ACN42_g9351, partial [Penicillium freii]
LLVPQYNIHCGFIYLPVDSNTHQQ